LKARAIRREKKNLRVLAAKQRSYRERWGGEGRSSESGVRSAEHREIHRLKREREKGTVSNPRNKAAG